MSNDKNKRKQQKKQNIIELPDKPWDKIDVEPIKLYNYFCYYRDSIYYSECDDDNPKKSPTLMIDSTKKRSYVATAAVFGCTKWNIEKAAKKFRWQERCQAYDSHVALVLRQENEKQIRKMLNNHAILGNAMISKAVKRFLNMKDNELSAADTIRMADVGVKIERMSRGIGGDETTIQLNTAAVPPPEKKPTASVDEMPVFDLSRLSDAELKALDDIVGKLTNTSEAEE